MSAPTIAAHPLAGVDRAMLVRLARSALCVHVVATVAISFVLPSGSAALAAWFAALAAGALLGPGLVRPPKIVVSHFRERAWLAVFSLLAGFAWLGFVSALMIAAYAAGASPSSYVGAGVALLAAGLWSQGVMLGAVRLEG